MESGKGAPKKRIMVGVNLLNNQDSIAYTNHMQLWYNFGRHYTEFDFFCHMPRRQPIDVMRNNTASFALHNNCDYILFLDDDVIAPIDGLKKLIACDADVAAGVTFIRGTPFNPMIFEFKRKIEEDQEDKIVLGYMRDYKDKADEKGIIKCAAVGFSFALLKVETLKKLPRPYFMTGEFNTEDVYYCCKLRDKLKDVNIVVDSTVDTQHLLDREYVDASNVEELRERCKEKNEDRSFEYAQEAVKRIA